MLFRDVISDVVVGAGAIFFAGFFLAFFFAISSIFSLSLEAPRIFFHASLQ